MTAISSSFFDVRPLDTDGGAVLVVSRPRLTEEENLEQLDRDFGILLDTFGLRKIVLDLQCVTYMTSAAIGKLISLHRQLARTGGKLVLCRLQPAVRETLTTTHLLTYFHVAESVEAGCAELS